jgi:hypothetical protein
MNRLHPRTSVHRLPVRATVITGAALGLLAGAAVFGGVSSAASGHQPAALRPVAVTTAPARAARCAPGSTLVKRVCIVHVVRTVVVPETAAPVPAAARLPAVRPGTTTTPAPAKAAITTPAATTRATATRRPTPATPTPTPTGDDD